jgi:two-component system OmpR family response regulator
MTCLASCLINGASTYGNNRKSVAILAIGKDRRVLSLATLTEEDPPTSLNICAMRILMIEDDKAAAAYLTKGLTESGHVVDRAADGEDGLHLALTGQYDVLILDRMLPKRDGLTLVRMLRADGRDTPVLVLSALGEVDDRVQGLIAGGDDYLAKPYAFSELLARLDALVRRSRPAAQPPHHLRVSDLELELTLHRVTRAGKPIRL